MTLEQKASDYVSQRIPHNSAIYVTMKKQEIIDIVRDAYIEAGAEIEKLQSELKKYKNEGSKQRTNNSGSM